MASSLFRKETFSAFGFLLAEEKCKWVPSKKVIWLGRVIDMHQNLLYITDEIVLKLLAKIQSILSYIENCESKLNPVRLLANVVGQIISMQRLLGNNVTLMTRELFSCINSRASWNAPVKVTPEGKKELVFWGENVESFNNKGKPIKDKQLCRFSIYSDASGTGYGGYVVETLDDNFSLSKGREILDMSVTKGFSEMDYARTSLAPEVVSVNEETNEMVLKSDKAAE